MSRKGENIFKRKDGRWEARYIKGRDCSGKALYGYCYAKSYRTAKEKVTKLKAVLAEQGAAAGNSPPFAFYCDGWLSKKAQKVKESTYIKYAVILEKHLKPCLGSCTLKAITSQRIEAFSCELLQHRQLSSKTVRDILVVLRSVLDYMAREITGKSSTVEILYPREEQKEPRVLSREEQSRLTSYLLEDMDLCKFGAMLALLTGIRIGELCALRWTDLSAEDRCLRVAATLQRLQNNRDLEKGKTRMVFQPPKTGASARVIPLTEYAFRLCERMRPENPGVFVLTGTDNFMDPRTLQYRLQGYMRACGLEDVHFHTLRHTFATRCAEVGFEIKSLSEVLGHASTSITLKRYVHSSLELKRDNMLKLAAVGL